MLNRGIKKWDLVLLVINSIIGAGIFGLPSKIFALSGVYSLLAFGATALVVLIFVACFAEVSTQFDKTGGPYVYTLQSLGKPAAFGMGWLLQLSRWFNYATLINLQVIYISFFIPSIKEPIPRAGFILAITLFLSYMNHRGVRDSTRVSNIFTITKLAILIAFIVVGLFYIKPELFKVAEAPTLPDFSTSVLLLVFAFGGFESVLINSGEIINPKKNLPFALITGILVVTSVYCLIQTVCIGTLPDLASTDKPLADAANGFMGTTGAGIITAGAAISIFGTLNAILLSGSRLPFALSTEGQFPAIFSYVHPRFRTPTWSLVLFSVLAIAISVAWSFITALAIGAIIRVMVYMIVCIALIRLRQIKGKDAIPFRIPFGPVLAVIGIIISLWLLSSSKANEIRDVAICMLAGLLLYIFLQFAKRSRS